MEQFFGVSKYKCTLSAEASLLTKGGNMKKACSKESGFTSSRDKWLLLAGFVLKFDDLVGRWKALG